MPTNYPGSPDTFNEPSQPESTALNQGGNQPAPSRNHYEHHRDLGDAVQALQEYAALRSHDHSGTPGDRTKGGKLAQANTHENADTNSSANAIHHTLGTGAGQAAAGNHNHDYSTLLNVPWYRCTSSTRPTGIPAGTMIYETDTNRARVWAQFTASNVTVSGIDSTDTFDRTDPDSLGSGWQQVYTPGSFGKMGTDGNHCVWNDSGNDPARCVARRINPADAVTQTDNQKITWRFETDLEIVLPFLGGTIASNDMYFRMSADGNSYLRLTYTYDQWGRGRVSLYATKTGPGGEEDLGSLSTAATAKADTYWVAELVGDRITVSSGPTVAGATFNHGQLTIPSGVSNKGSGYRGWGIGMVAGNRNQLAGLVEGQVSPASLSMVNIKDVTYQTGQEIWQLLPIANVPTVRLAQEKNQSIDPSGSFIEWTQEIEDNFGYFNPASSSTTINVADAGLYQFHFGIQWGVSFIPETAVVVVCVNGQDSILRKSQVQIRPGLFSSLGGGSADLSPTIAFSGQLRLASGDRISVRCRYGAGTFTTLLNTYFDANSKVKSRMEMRFLGP